MKYTGFFSIVLFIFVVTFAGCQNNMDNPAGIDSGGFISLDRPGGNADVFAVVTESNSSSGNEVIVYSRGHDGTLSYSGSYSTGGSGSGAGLGSQGAVVISG